MSHAGWKKTGFFNRLLINRAGKHSADRRKARTVCKTTDIRIRPARPFRNKDPQRISKSQSLRNNALKPRNFTIDDALSAINTDQHIIHEPNASGWRLQKGNC